LPAMRRGGREACAPTPKKTEWVGWKSRDGRGALGFVAWLCRIRP
jgi:hypothetical protein